jgi:threonine aldolase
MKQQGAMLAKGRLLGVQFGAVLENGLYVKLAQQAAQAAGRLAEGLAALGVPMLIDSPSNQIFPILSNDTIGTLAQSVSFEHWSTVDDNHSCIRFVTAWHTTQAEVDALLDLLRQLIG